MNAWRRHTLLPLYGVACAVLAFVLMSCDSGTASDAPARPDGVPKAAIWVGGADGGVFLLLKQDARDPAGSLRGCIFADGGPYLLYNGLLAPEEGAQVTGPITEPETYDGWDGTRLYLAGGGWLRAASPFNPFTFGHDDSAGACDLEYAPARPPLPAGVPDTALWRGGPYDGAFLALEPGDGTAGTYRGTIYYDHSGAVWYDGGFAVDPSDTGPIDVGDPSQVVDWTGYEIVLADGRRLVPTDPID